MMSYIKHRNWLALAVVGALFQVSGLVYASGVYSSAVLSGILQKATLDITINPDRSVVGSPGALYVAAKLSDGTWYSSTQAAGWQLWNHNTTMPAYSTIAAMPATLTITPIQNMDVTSYIGAEIYAGYGLDFAAMLNNTTYNSVYAVPNGAIDISTLSAEAYIWGLAPEFVRRFAKYHSLVSAPSNTLKYGIEPAAWNNAGTNAPDASVMYLNAFPDFSTASELVLTVPPSVNQYYVAAFLDSYIDTMGSIGTRTTPTNDYSYYLLVGPNSQYAGQQTATINGFNFPVMASDTNLNWLLVRILVNTLADADKSDSVPKIYSTVSQKFALNTLNDFIANGFKPVYPASYQYTPTSVDLEIAKAYQNTPTSAEIFFKQLGDALVTSPLPDITTGLSGTSLSNLPSYVVPQFGADQTYEVPAYGQKATLDRFAPIGLTAQGFTIPSNWTRSQLAAMQVGFSAGQAYLQKLISLANGSSSTNYWSIINNMIGYYPNTVEGYQLRSIIVLAGGSANIPLDAVYPSMLSNSNGALDGNNTYSITFTPSSSGGNTQYPVSGSFPPLVKNSTGHSIGFWSVTAYQPDSSEAASPFLSQASVLNNAYSTPDVSVVAVDAAKDTLTVRAPSWGSLAMSTPILFNDTGAQAYGLTGKSANGVYFIANTPTETLDPLTKQTLYTFQISNQWIQDLSSNNVPIQNSGVPGAITDITNGNGKLLYGVIKPVSQLGSSQLNDGQLKLNSDGSLTIWFGSALPAGAPASNWIPTPSTAYFNNIYGSATDVSTSLEVLLRMYYPEPGNSPPSILPYTDGTTTFAETYVPPQLVLQPTN